MSKQTEPTETPDTKRAPYEAPQLTMVELKPEEQLLTCSKSGLCPPVPTFS